MNNLLQSCNTMMTAMEAVMLLASANDDTATMVKMMIYLSLFEHLLVKPLIECSHG